MILTKSFISFKLFSERREEAGGQTENMKLCISQVSCLKNMCKNLRVSTDHRQFIIDQIVITFF
jgi:hypothetical protein